MICRLRTGAPISGQHHVDRGSPSHPVTHRHFRRLGFVFIIQCAEDTTPSSQPGHEQSIDPHQIGFAWVSLSRITIIYNEKLQFGSKAKETLWAVVSVVWMRDYREMYAYCVLAMLIHQTGCLLRSSSHPLTYHIVEEILPFFFTSALTVVDDVFTVCLDADGLCALLLNICIYTYHYAVPFVPVEALADRYTGWMLAEDVHDF